MTLSRVHLHPYPFLLIIEDNGAHTESSDWSVLIYRKRSLKHETTNYSTLLNLYVRHIRNVGGTIKDQLLIGLLNTRKHVLV